MEVTVGKLTLYTGRNGNNHGLMPSLILDNFVGFTTAAAASVPATPPSEQLSPFWGIALNKISDSLPARMVQSAKRLSDRGDSAADE